MKFYAHITENKLKFINTDYLKGFLKQMPEGQHLMIDIEKRKRIRSNPQNSMYWGHILPTISDETGHSCEELHFFFKRTLLPRKYIKVADRRILAEPTTTNLSTKEFTDYIEQILVWSAQNLSIEWDLQF